MLGIPLLGAIPEDQQVIVSTNRGEPLVLQKKLSLSGIAFENAARRLIGKQDYFVDLNTPYKVCVCAYYSFRLLTPILLCTCMHTPFTRSSAT